MLNETGMMSEFSLRDLIKTESTNCRTPWVNELPSALREGAAFEARKNMKAALTNLEQGNISHFTMGYKRKKDRGWTITGFQTQNFERVDEHHCYTLGREKLGLLKTLEPLPRWIDNQISLHFDGYDYWLCVPITAKVDLQDDHDYRHVVAVDPGVRTFATVYDPDGVAMDIGTQDSTVAVLYNYARHLDNHYTALQKKRYPNEARRVKSKQEKKRFAEKVRGRIERTKRRMANLQRELHDKTIHFLTSYAKVVVIPPFNAHEMNGKRNRKIRTKTVRHMSLLAHGKFRERLIAKAALRNCRVLVSSEAYTTKTCGACGRLNDVGSRKAFICTSCGQGHDRDINGARNILIRATHFTPMSSAELQSILQYRRSMLSFFASGQGG